MLVVIPIVVVLVFLVMTFAVRRADIMALMLFLLDPF